MKINFCKNRIWNVKSERGFTLVELIMVMVVTGILSSSLVIPFISGIKQGTRPEIYATATYLAQQRIEEQRSLGYTTISTGTPNTIGGIGTATPPDFITDEGDPNERTYTETVVTEYVTHSGSSFSTSGSSTEYIRATATVSNSNIPNDVELWTILAKDFYDPDAN